MKPLETGKLKFEFLEKILGKIEIADRRVVVGPGIGEDAAAIDMGVFPSVSCDRSEGGVYCAKSGSKDDQSRTARPDRPSSIRE